ncbi:MAG: carbon-nitrogen hydrolase family protein [Paraclostridium sp.]
MRKCRVGVIQMHIEDNKDINLQTAKNFIEKAYREGVDLVILPEMFCCPYRASKFPLYAEFEGESTYEFLSNISKEYGIYLVAGSMPEKDLEGNIFNTSYAFDRNGHLIVKHRKIHLFDVVINGKNLMESKTITSGDSISVFDTEFGKIGLAICYDFRFPEMARMLVNEGAECIIVPAAFNMKTGPAHWELMFRSRAVDNQVYTIGCAPARDYDAPYVSYGNSLVVSPWGSIIHSLADKEGYFICEIDFDYVRQIRSELPLLKHRRCDIYN